jgi:phage gp36-like protein
MSWITLTTSDLKSRLAEKESEALGEYLVEGFDETADSILRGSIAEVRAAVDQCEENTLGPDGTVPQSLQEQCLVIARHRLLDCIPTENNTFLTESRKADYDRATTRLELVARGDFGIGEEGYSEDPTPRIHHRNRHFSRHDEFGL